MGTEQGNLLTPYVPRLVIDWLREERTVARRSIPGTVVFADISGFTQLTELLARRGKVGAEEMGDILNTVFEALLAAAYDYSAGLVKWGGDAVLLLFEDDDHAERAAKAASEMQRVIRSVGRLRTAGGAVRLRMSIGIHTGAIDFLLVGHHNRELIVTGPAATTVALMEKAADAGQVVVSDATADAVRAAGGSVGDRKGPGWLLDRPPPGVTERSMRAVTLPGDVDLGVALPSALREHLLEGAADSEHRHVAIGFIEFSGADALAIAEDPDDLTAAVEHLIANSQEAAEANGVTILSTDVNADGGKVIFISGAPRRVGDDEARVLATVRAVLDGDGPLSLRAGVNAGRVFAGDFGPPYRRNYSVAGDCVNLAARLMGAAGPGQLLATEALVARTGGRFHTTPVPPFHVKGKQDPVIAVRVDGTRVDRERARHDSIPMVGRDSELHTLLDAVASAADGVGQTVDLVGPAGIGKSRLLEELAVVSDRPILWVDGDVYGEATPYKPIRRFVREQLGLGASDSRATVAAAFRELVQAQAPSMLPWLPLVGRVVDADFPMTPTVAEIDLGARKDRMEWAISALLGAMITEPTIIVFNDAHLMDDATVDLVRRLNADAHSRPWLVVTSYRADDRAQVAEGTTVIPLEPLTEEAAAALLAAVTDDFPLPAHQLTAVAERANGNPLFLRELAASALDDGLSGDLPDSIEGIVSARIDRLRPAQRRTLRAASVLGMVIELPLFQAVLEADNALDAGGASDLRALPEFIHALDGERLQFRHHMARESAYEGLPYRRRRTLHAHTADAIERTAGREKDDRADLLSLHSYHGDRHEAAWHYSVIAGDRARSQYANAEAADCYERALQSARRLGRAAGLDVAGVSEKLGDVCFELGDLQRAEHALRGAHGDKGLAPDVLARLRMKLALIHESTGRYSSALRWITKGRHSVEDDPTEAARLVAGQLTARYARVLHLQGRNVEAVRWATRAMDDAERTGDDQTLAQALEYLDWAEVALGRTAAEPRAQRSLAIYEASGDLCGQGRIHNSLGIRAYFLGHWPEAIEHYRMAAAVYRRAGREWSAATADANVAEVLSDQGHIVEAREMLEAAMRVWRGARAWPEIAFGNFQLGRIAARSGGFDEAFRRFEDARSFSTESGEMARLVVVDSFVAEAHLLAGHDTEALAVAEDALERAASSDGLVESVPLLHRVRATALGRSGHRDEEEAALRESLRTARQRDAMHDIALALAQLLAASCAADDAEEAAWRAEHDQLRTRLGMVPQDHPEVAPTVGAVSR